MLTSYAGQYTPDDAYIVASVCVYVCVYMISMFNKIILFLLFVILYLLVIIVDRPWTVYKSSYSPEPNS